MKSSNENIASGYVTSGVSRYGRYVFRKWWMCVVDENNEFVGFISTDATNYCNKPSVLRSIKSDLRKKAKKRGYKCVGLLNHG